MSYGNEQQREIETIREKKITVKLSEADCIRISELCGKHNITVGGLIEDFIEDLIGGTYSNGSDEREFARNYFDRCWFGMFPERTLLNFLLEGWECDVEDFVSLLEDIQICREDIENCDQSDQDELDFLRQELADREQELAEVKAAYLKEKADSNWDEEVAAVKAWYEEMERMRDE